MIAQAIRRYKQNQAPEIRKAFQLCKRFKDVLKVYRHYNHQILREQIYTVSQLIMTLKADYGYVPDRVYSVCARLTQKLNKEMVNSYLKEYH